MIVPRPVTQIPRSLNERGIALLLTLLLALLVVSLAIGVLLMMTNTTLITRFHLSDASTSNLASAGLEQARDTLNGDPSLLPRPTGFATLELNAPLTDASGAVITGLTRSTYAGLTGGATGQLGLYSTVLSVVSNARGPLVIRRADLRQETFASYSRFWNTWPGGQVGPVEVHFGPVHSNQGMVLSSGSPGPVFRGPVTTVGTITNQPNGQFPGGVATGVSPILFPTAAQINALRPIATSAGLEIAGYGDMNATDPSVRIEFIAMDLNSDGDTSDENEGFFRVFRAQNSSSSGDRAYVTARPWGGVGGSWSSVTSFSDPNIRSPNCGGRIEVTGVSTWLRADTLVEMFGTANAARDTIRFALSGDYRRCYLGGDPRLFGSQWVTNTPYGRFDSYAGWGGSPPAALVTALAAQGIDPSTDANSVAQTFWPLGQSHNPNGRGVIYVTGSVAVSGHLRGRVTLVAQGNIMIADDITYAQAPNTSCADILGLISLRSVLLEDNTVNTPFRVAGTWTPMFDETPDEFLHAFLMGLNSSNGVSGEDLSGDDSPQPPEACGFIVGATSRGCRFLSGGITQPGTGVSFGVDRTGWRDQDTYDQCGSVNPPPYYPTTGEYTKYRFYEIDPVGFDPAIWFAANQ